MFTFRPPQTALKKRFQPAYQIGLHDPYVQAAEKVQAESATPEIRGA